MAKKNKVKIPSQPQQPGKALLMKEQEDVAALAASAEVELPVLPTEQELAALSPPDRTELKQRLNELADVLGSLIKLREEHREMLAEARAQADQAAQATADLDRRAELLNERERSINDRDAELTVREAEARSGFVAQQREALETLKGDIARLEAERERVVAETRTHASEVRAQLRQEGEELAQERARLAGVARKYEQEREEIEVRRANDREREGHIRELALLEGKEQARQLGQELELARRSLELHVREIDEQRVQLRGYADLENTLRVRGFHSPEELLDRHDSLEKEVRKLRQAEVLRPLDDIEEQNEALRDRCDDLEQRNRDLTRELEQIRNERDLNRLGVLEKQNLAQEKRVLEQHKRALDAAVTDLQTRLDDLTSRQQGGEVFPALMAMDRKLDFRPATESAPDLESLVTLLRNRMAQTKGLYYNEETLRLFVGGMAMGQLQVLQGISGTGKTSLATAFADAVGGHCTVVPVQAGWRDRDDLLGHFNAFEKRYYERECLQAIYRASTESYGDRVNIVLLDEMNLSRPEQYFAEFLSALELRAEQREIVMMETSVAQAPTAFKEGRKLPIPDNLWFVGTANHDETTFEFADKTFDRANVIELPRQEASFAPDSSAGPEMIGVSSLHELFRKAQKAHADTVAAALAEVQGSEFSKVLSRDFGLGWGSRFERQVMSFAPVVMAAGGTLGAALDHLLASRLFRAGKVTGRYDTSADALRSLEDALVTLWPQVDRRDDVPDACLDRLAKEIIRKEQE